MCFSKLPCEAGKKDTVIFILKEQHLKEKAHQCLGKYTQEIEGER